MKKDEVPQDDEGMFEGKFKVMKYALDDEGNYSTVGSSGWEPENTVLNQAWELVNKKIEEAKAKIADGEASTLLFHMEKNIMDVGMLSQYMDLPKRKIETHLTKDGFSSLEENVLKKYAEVFDISVEELKTISE